MIDIVLNGEKATVDANSVLADVIQERGCINQPYAVAVNECFVPQDKHQSMILRSGDRVELVIAIQGG